VNPALGVHRTFYLYQLITEKFILSLSLRIVQFSSFSYFPLTLTPMWSFIPETCLRPVLSWCIVSPPRTSTSQEERVWSSWDRLQGSVLVLCGVQSCVAA
jgi:hypothetical protein